MITIGCNVAESKTTTVSAIVDFGDLNVKLFAKRLKLLAEKNELIKWSILHNLVIHIQQLTFLLVSLES